MYGISKGLGPECNQARKLTTSIRLQRSDGHNSAILVQKGLLKYNLLSAFGILQYLSKTMSEVLMCSENKLLQI